MAQRLGVDRRSVRRWKAAARGGGGREALRARPVPGRPTKLDERQRRRLEKLLLKGPLAAGSRPICDLSAVAELIERNFAVAYHVDHVGACCMNWLESAEAYAPSRRARRGGNPALDARGLATSKKNAARWGAAIVFIDEAGFMMGPHRRRSWAPRGHTAVLHQRGRSRLKVSVIGALSISPGRHRVRAWFAFEPQASFDGAHILAFLRALLRSLRCPVVLVWDRLQAHRGEPIKVGSPRTIIAFMPNCCLPTPPNSIQSK